MEGNVVALDVARARGPAVRVPTTALLEDLVTEHSWGFEEGDQIVPGLHALKLLGGGHEYEVYLAWSDELFALVVAKLLRPDRSGDAAAIRRVRREASILDAVAHPVLVRSFGARFDGPVPHLVLEHLEGPTLASLIKRHGRLEIDQVLPLALHVSAALHHLHRRGFVHLDVKPGNIVMGAPPRLIDLSVARAIDRAKRLRYVVGTDAYMAPEQCAPGVAGEMGPASDVWGLGATLYEALSGRRPFVAPDQRFPQLDMQPPPLEGPWPPELSAAIGATLDPDLERRPDPAAFAMSLEPFVAELPRRPVLGRLRPRWR